MSGYGGVGGGAGPASGLLGAILDRAQDTLFALASCVPCGPSSSTLKLNGRTFKIVKLLGEGGFSFVYLAQDAESGRYFALKKIRCSYGSEGLTEAMKEVEATKRFRSPNIIRIFDSAVVQEGEGKLIYLFLPYYARGNVQDAINAHVVHGSSFAEKEMLAIFRGTCEAVKAMHTYRLPDVGAHRAGGRRPAQSSTTVDQERAEEGAQTGDQDQVPLMSLQGHAGADGTEDAEGSAYPPRPNPNPGAGKEVVRPALGGDGVEEGRGGEMVPYAHRDIKPANVMIADDGSTPILMDFGSAIRARVPIRSRREAVAHQDMAAERSSMPYRAPELFDVKTDTTLDEKVDIWSLGCTLFAMAYHHSPFETPATVEQGGSLAMAVLNGAYRFPSSDHYSEATRNCISACLETDPAKRPDIDGLIALVDRALRGVS